MVSSIDRVFKRMVPTQHIIAMIGRNNCTGNRIIFCIEFSFHAISLKSLGHRHRRRANRNKAILMNKNAEEKFKHCIPTFVVIYLMDRYLYFIVDFCKITINYWIYNIEILKSPSQLWIYNSARLKSPSHLWIYNSARVKRTSHLWIYNSARMKKS